MDGWKASATDAISLPGDGQSAEGLNFTVRMQLLCADIASRLPELGHVDPQRICFSFSRTRKRVRHGLWASLTPMRFKGGARTGTRAGHRYMCQRLYDHHGREMLYILTFYLPRFLNLDFANKLTTIFHELWHIGPEFDGDLRRHAGRCYAHTHSQKGYDTAMEQLVEQYLALAPPSELYRFLRYPFNQLQRRYGSIYGMRVAQPRLIPIE